MVYRLARALVMVLMARARGDGRTVEVMHVECGRARLALLVEAWIAYRPVPVLQGLARGWPFDRLDASGTHYVHGAAVLDQSLALPDVGFCDGSGAGGAIRGLLDMVQGRFGVATLELGRVLRRRWMRRKIAFESMSG